MGGEGDKEKTGVLEEELTLINAAAALKLMWATDSLFLRGTWVQPDRMLLKEVKETTPGVRGGRTGCGVRGRSTSSGCRKGRPRAKGSTI